MRRLRSAFAILAGAAMLAACGSTVQGQAQAGSDSSVGTSADSTAKGGKSTPDESSAQESTSGESSDGASSEQSEDAGAGTGGDISPADFAAAVADGMKDVTSLKGKMEMSVASQKITATIDETIADSKMTSAIMDMDLMGQSMKMLIVDGKNYLGGSSQLLTALNIPTDKKWVLLDKNSSNSAIKAMATSMEASMEQAGVDQYVVMAKALKSIKKSGQEDVEGQSATKYDVVIDAAKMPTTDSGSLAASGLKEIPATFWVDEKNRLVKVNMDLEVQGTKSAVNFVVTDYNVPVDIAAPDAGDVYTG